MTNPLPTALKAIGLTELDLFKNILKSLPYSVYWEDTQGTILGGSDYAASLAGLTSIQEMIGKNAYTDFAWKNEGHLLRAIDQEVMRTRQQRQVEETVAVHGGEIKTFLSMKAPLINDKDEVIGIFGISTDITAHKKAQAQALETAEHSIIELEKTQIELKKAKDRAEMLSQSKTDFLANMSHELRTPLNGIIGIAQILSYSNLPLDAREKVNDLMSAGKSLLALIDDVLNFSKIEAGKIEFAEDSFDLRKLLEELVNSLSYVTLEKNLPIILSYPEGLPRYLVGDALRVRQIITNLVGNAIKFTQKGHVLVTVDCLKQAPDQAMMQISVEDTGVGIPHDKLEYIFERFHQVTPSYTTQQRGTGLGLAIVRKFVEGMNGQISVHSEVGKGSTFVFSLPFKVQKNPIQDNIWLRDYSALRVLVVDDNPLRGAMVLRQIPGAPGRCVSSSQAVAELTRALESKEIYHIIVVDQTITNPVATVLATEIAAIKDYKPLLMLITEFNEHHSKIEGYFRLLSRAQQTRWLDILQDSWDRWAAQAGIETMKSPQRKLKVLLVEDNYLNQRVAIAMLREHFNCQVEAVDTGQQALEKFDRSFDIVFLDIGLPDMSGFDVAKLLNARKAAEGFDVPIVSMTAHAEGSVARNAFKDAGIVAVVTKPIMMSALCDVIERTVFEAEAC